MTARHSSPRHPPADDTAQERRPLTLAPLSDADWPDALSDLKGGFTGQGNVYRTMAHHPALLSAWQDLRRHVVTANALGPERLEVVILRVAHGLGAPYERAHHIIRARKLGFTDARIASLEGPTEGMGPDDARLARAVDALLDAAHLPQALLRDLLQRIGKAAVLDLIATVGFYTTLGFIVKSFNTPIDADIADALEKRPFRPEAPGSR